MTSPEPQRPAVLETVLFEPDQGRVLAVLPGVVWPAPGDVVELDAPPRSARVLSTRLQLVGALARVLVLLDVPDDGVDALRIEVPLGVTPGAEADDPEHLLDRELEDDLDVLESEEEEGSPTRG